MVCTVTEVEETKQMLPSWVATFVPSTMIAQINTLLVKKGTTLDRSMDPHFHIQPASLTGFVILSMLVSVVLYGRLFVPLAGSITGNPRGFALHHMGVGFFLHIIIMLFASFTERHRLAVASPNGIYGADGQVHFSIFVLLPQFVLMGVADSLEVAKLDFFYDQAPQPRHLLRHDQSGSATS